jgi:hypothetical protein
VGLAAEELDEALGVLVGLTAPGGRIWPGRGGSSGTARNARRPRYGGVGASAMWCRLMCVGVGSRVGFPASGSVRLA